MAFICQLSGHYKSRLLTIAAKRLSSPTSPTLTSTATETAVPTPTSHTEPNNKNSHNNNNNNDADDDNNRTFSHLELKVDIVMVLEGAVCGKRDGEKGRGRRGVYTEKLHYYYLSLWGLCVCAI